MASNQTVHYGLNQWQPEDKVLREEFNGDNQKVDTALHSLAEEVGAKAAQTEVDGLKTQLSYKASQSALDSLSAQVAAKAAQSSLDHLSASLTANLGQKFGTDNPYIKTGTYLGTGSGDVSITLGFQPAYVMVIAQYPGDISQLDFVLLYGTAQIQVQVRQGGSTEPNTNILTFSPSGFTIPAASTINFNTAGMTYHYIAFR